MTMWPLATSPGRSCHRLTDVTWEKGKVESPPAPGRGLSKGSCYAERQLVPVGHLCRKDPRLTSVHKPSVKRAIELARSLQECDAQDSRHGKRRDLREPDVRQSRAWRTRTYPNFAYLLYEALISVYRSARQVEAELSHEVVWRFARRMVRKMFPDDRKMRLPGKPMRRHHYLYVRNHYLTDPEVLKRISALHRETSCKQARELGLVDPSGPGSFTHPDLSRMLYADGKVITPLFKGRLGETRTDTATGEIKQVRFEPDADLHFEGDGELAYGTKFVVVAARSGEARGRMILDIDWVPDKGGEAKAAMGCFERLSPLVPGAQGVIYDTALRGIHHQTLLRNLGLLPVNRVTAKKKGSTKPRRAEGRRVEKSVHVEDKKVRLPDGSRESRVAVRPRWGHRHREVVGQRRAKLR